MTDAVDQPASTEPPGSGFWETFPRIRWLAIVFMILAWVGVIASGSAWWVHQTLLDTDGWVELVGPVATDEAVTEAVATRISSEIVEVLDLEDRLANRLPEPLDILALPLAGFAEGFIHDRVLDAVQGERFRVIWEEANRIAHSTVVTILRGGAGPLEVSGGVVTLDLAGVVSDVLSGVATRLGDLLGVDLSGVGSGGLISLLEDRLGIDVPDDFGTIVVFESDALSEAQQTVRVLDALFWLLPLLTALLFAAALALSEDRRKAGITLAIGASIAALVAWLLTSAVEAAIVDAIVGRGREAAGSVIASVAGSLRGTFLLLALVVAVVAVVLAALQLRGSAEPE